MDDSVPQARSVLHIDMNAFYCSCHAAAHPGRYRGLPTAVAGSPETRHGVVVTASYEARRRGVRATMTTLQALRACPELTLIAPDFDLYREFSHRVFEVVRNYTPQVEIFSIDECWADVTGSRQFGTAEEIARTIQSRIRDELGLPCSIGVAPNKFLAKMASDLQKPLGLTRLGLADLPERLWPLPVENMFGIGEKTAERLRRLNIHTIGDLAAANPAKLLRYLGSRGPELRALANGEDASEVRAEPEPVKSVGHSITLAVDADAREEIDTVLLNLSDQVGRRVRRHQMTGRTVQVTIRYANRDTVTRSQTLPHFTNLTEEIYSAARTLVAAHRKAGAKIRLLGVTLQNLTSTSGGRDDTGRGAGQGGAGQEAERGAIRGEGTWRRVDEPGRQLELPLFDDPPVFGTNGSYAAGGGGRDERGRPSAFASGDDRFDPVRRERLQRLTEVSDRLRDRFGENAVIRGRMLQPHESSQIRDRRSRGTSLQKDNLRRAGDADDTAAGNGGNGRDDRNDRGGRTGH